MTTPTLLAQGLAFPEGPVVMPDGSLVVTEIAAGCLTRIAGGKALRLADTGCTSNHRRIQAPCPAS